MAKKKDENVQYDKLVSDIQGHTLQHLYAFYGAERYLLEMWLKEIRKFIPEGTEEFNLHRIDGKQFSVDALADAVNAMPAFSEMTLTEINDLDLSKINDETRSALYDILSDIPEYAYVIFVFDTVEFKLDGRVKANAALKKLFTSVEFTTQGEEKLVKWIKKHFRASGKRIDDIAAKHLVFVTGSSMTSMNMEIEKLSSYCTGDTVTMADIDLLVTPVLDAAVYELTDAILTGNNDLAVKKMGDLLLLGEAGQRIIFSISLKLRELLVAKLFIEMNRSMSEFMKYFDIRYEFQARAIYSAARKLSKSQCCDMVKIACDTAYKLNSTSQSDNEILMELLIRLSSVQRAVR
jgi:DNA polymerase-3 subunit delta